MRTLIAGNWKMNPATQDEARALAGGVAAGVAGVDLLVCPPATALAAVAQALRGGPVALGAQNCSAQPPGAHTGEIAAAMLRDLGVSHVILGHSERRGGHGETDLMVRDKVLAARACGLVPIVCVGETENQRLARTHTDVVGSQLRHGLPDDFDGVVAYEPVWAIGTGRSATVEDVAAMHLFIATTLRARFPHAVLPVLYGGSVKAANAAWLLATPHVDGALVGGASLDAAEFLAIARARARA